MSHIPPELSDYIIDFLHDDRLALKACSLASRDWRPAARYHLYRSVSLQSLESCRVYHRLLQDSAVLATFARELSISNTAAEIGPDGRFDSAQAQELDLLWTSILPALIAIERLDMSFMKINDLLQTKLVHNFNTITDLSIQYCRFPSFFDLVAAVHSFPSLKGCTLRGLSWDEPHASTAATPLEPMGVAPRLTKLTLGRDLPLEAIVSWLLTEDVCKELTHFSGCCSSAVDAVLLSELVRSASSTLKDLALDWYSSSYSDVSLPAEFSIGPCPELESLTLRCPIALSSTVPWVTGMLGQVTPASLKIFRLDVRLLGSLVALSWANLESRLLRPEFSKLASVEVKLLIWHTATGISDDVTSTVYRLLPALHAKGMLHVSCV